MTQKITSPGRLFLGYLFDVFAPMAVFAVLKALGVSQLWGLVFGAAFALGGTVVNTIAHRRLDRVGVFVLVELGLSIGLIFVTGSPQVMLAKPSVYTLAAGIFLFLNARTGKPINYEAIRSLAMQGGAERGAVFDRVWDTSADFRRTMRMSLVGWGVILLLDTTARLWVVFTYPFETAAWASNIPHLVSIGILAAFSALMGRRTKAAILRELARTATPPDQPASFSPAP